MKKYSNIPGLFLLFSVIVSTQELITESFWLQKSIFLQEIQRSTQPPPRNKYVIGFEDISDLDNAN